MWSATISAIEASTKMTILTCGEMLLINKGLIDSFYPFNGYGSFIRGSLFKNQDFLSELIKQLKKTAAAAHDTGQRVFGNDNGQPYFLHQ